MLHTCLVLTELFILQIKQGVDVVKRVEGVGSNSGSTSKTVKIADSGELKE